MELPSEVENGFKELNRTCLGRQSSWNFNVTCFSNTKGSNGQQHWMLSKAMSLDLYKYVFEQ